MNEQVRKGANALVAVVDFFSVVLAHEAQVGEMQEQQVRRMADQLRDCSASEEQVRLLKERVAFVESASRESGANLDKAYSALLAEFKLKEEQVDAQARAIAEEVQRSHEWKVEVQVLRDELAREKTARQREKLPQESALALLELVEVAEGIDRWASTQAADRGLLDALVSRTRVVVRRLGDVRSGLTS